MSKNRAPQKVLIEEEHLEKSLTLSFSLTSLNVNENKGGLMNILNE